MLEMGFVDDIMRIASYLPEKKQTLLFSATMAPKILTLAKKTLINPVEVKLSVSKPAEKISQSAYVCYETQKMPIIESIFKNKSPERVIIFSSSKQKVKDIYLMLRRMNLKVAAMHSDLEQKEREDVLRQFKNGSIKLLVATDIVARGIDIEDIEMVINFDVPHDVEDYVHRIGRTARANADGEAITFISDKEQYKFKAIENFIEKDVKKIPVPEEIRATPLYNPIKQEGDGRKIFYRKYKNNRPKRNTN